MMTRYAVLLCAAFIVALLALPALAQDDGWQPPPSYSEQKRKAQERKAAETKTRRLKQGHLEHRLSQHFGERLKGIKFWRLSAANWVVRVEFMASDNLTPGMIASGIEIDAKDCFHLIFTTDTAPIAKAILEGHFVLVDRYGNEFETAVYQATMKRELATKINWANRGLISLAGLGLVDFVHPALSGH